MTSTDAIHEHYSESVNMAAFSSDGRTEINIRLARKPGTEQASIWAHVAIGDLLLSLVDESLDSGKACLTPGSSRAEFSASGSSFAIFKRENSARLNGTLHAYLLMHQTGHPDDGPGTLPMRLTASFAATMPCVSVTPGRLEVMGMIDVTVEFAGQTTRHQLPGKWHEQVGERSRFAPAFTYLNVQGHNTGLLAIGFARKASGYLVRDGELVTIDSFSISSAGADQRTFTLSTPGGDRVEGVAHSLRNWSVPIEGIRRPGSTVRVTSTLGELMGSLNDWKPEEDTQS